MKNFLIGQKTVSSQVLSKDEILREVLKIKFEMEEKIKNSSNEN